MLHTARRRLALFGDRVDVQRADATRLAFSDGRFDAVVSFIMLHHTLQWEEALGEAVRVLRPGGHLAGYDLVESGPARILHRFGTEGPGHDCIHPRRLPGHLSPHRLATFSGLSERLGQLPLEDVRVEPGASRSHRPVRSPPLRRHGGGAIRG